MSKHFMIVQKETCAIITEYFADGKSKDPEFMDENLWLHMEIPMDAVISYLRVSKGPKNTYSVVEDFSKKQTYYSIKLQELVDSVRNQRNRLLAECDWTMTLDAPLSDEKRQAWKKYRQKLRDITKTVTQHHQKIVWPTPPT
jgi:uncharacterized protein YhaN